MSEKEAFYYQCYEKKHFLLLADEWRKHWVHWSQNHYDKEKTKKVHQIRVVFSQTENNFNSKIVLSFLKAFSMDIISMLVVTTSYMYFFHL